jgi:Alw26I/Eco31I/Esp3I family type II restriction m6 adenine DNA methyltransferase
MGLIVPSSFLNEATSEKLRRHVFDTCAIEDVIEIPERSRIFPGVNQATAILVLNKSRPEDGEFHLRMGADAGSIESGDGGISIGYKELAAFTDGRMEVPLLNEPSIEWAMMKRLKGIPSFKGGKGVLPVGEISVGNVDETFDKEYISEEPTGHIFVKGIHLKEYVVDLSPEGRQPRWVKKDSFLRKRPSALAAVSRPRIIGRNTQNKACSRRLKFAMLPAGYLCSNSIKQIVITDAGIEPLYLLGLLNSSTLNWYFELFCSQNNIRNYRIEALPIVRAPGKVQDAFARVARLIMASKGLEREFFDKGLMDAMVFELYFGGPGLIEAAASGIVDEKTHQMMEAIKADERYRMVTKATNKK